MSYQTLQAKIEQLIEKASKGGSEKFIKLIEGVEDVELTADDLEGLTKVRQYAFDRASTLKGIVLPDTVTGIEQYAFRDSGLISAEIPDSVTSIAQYAFNGCTDLTRMSIPFVGQKADGTGATNFGYIFNGGSSNVNTPTGLQDGDLIITGGTSIANSAFKYFRMKSITLPPSVTSIGSSAFNQCTELEAVNIPEGVTTIGDHAFDQCYALSSIVIPDHVTRLNLYLFRSCSSLVNVNFGANSQLQSIGVSAFQSCSVLTSLAIPSGVTTIDSLALHIGSSTSPATIAMLPTTPPTIQSNTIGANVEKIIVPAGTLAAYQAATNWSSKASIMEEATA